jgi:hypothetical protein
MPRSSRLALALALAAVPSLAHGQTPPAPAAKVHVRTNGPNVVISRVTERAEAVAGVGEVAAFVDLCVAPCAFELSPGLHSLRMEADGVARVRRFVFAPGDNHLLADAGSSAKRSAMFWLVLTGSLAMSLGGSLALANSIADRGRQGWEIPTAIGGAALLGVGIGVGVSGMPSFEAERRTGAPAGARTVAGLSIDGHFAGL